MLKSNARPVGPRFTSNAPLCGTNLSSNARGMPGGGGGGGGEWAVLELTGTLVILI